LHLLVGFCRILAVPIRMMKEATEHEPLLHGHAEGLLH
jgi:hypothetical protein